MGTAIITGASGGIGSAIASRFIADGFEVFNLSRRDCRIPGVGNIACDLLDVTSLRRAITECLERVSFGKPVCLVHNAALLRKDSAEDCQDQQLLDVLQVSLLAANRINRALLPKMPGGSSLVYIGSTLSEQAVPGAFSYIVSKHAQLGMMRASCQDLAGRGIHTASVCPGFTDTDMLRSHLGDDEEALHAIATSNGFGRLVKPSEIAELVHWVHHNPAVNGAVLHANLGQLGR